MFGSVNALFSGLALAGIIFTILLQRLELKYQRDELKETRKEFQTQNETLKLQRFENTFFNLLSLHHQIVDSIDFSYYKNKNKGGSPITRRDYTTHGLGRGVQDEELITIKGRDVFRNRYQSLSRRTRFDNLDDCLRVYIQEYETIQSDFGHYFRNLYRMVKLVHETEFLDTTVTADLYKIRYKYTSIIRSQLSDYELLWLFYNCLSKNGIEKFKRLVEEYSLLKNLPQDKLISIHHKVKYNPQAFEPMK